MVPRAWIKIAETIEEFSFGDNGIATLFIEEKKYCLAKKGEVYHVFAYTCPHAGGIMANGFIDRLGNAVCPLHFFKFNIATGVNVSGEGYCLKRWPVDVRPEGVFVQWQKG